MSPDHSLVRGLVGVLLCAPAVALAADGPPREVRADVEYRIRHLTMNPLSLNDLTAADVAFFEHRLRGDVALELAPRVTLKLQADALDGVLFGDNGSFVGSPRRQRGALIATKGPNLARATVGILDTEASPLDRDNYGFVLEPAPALEINHVYVETMLPVGMLRAGRQPLSRHRTTLVHSGRRINRWGVSKAHDSADGLLFATKLSAIGDVLAGEPPDLDRDRGWFLGVLWGKTVTQLPSTPADDLDNVATSTFYKRRDEEILGVHVDLLDTALTHSRRGSDQFGTRLDSVTAAFEVQTDWVRFVLHHTEMAGETREVAEALSLLGKTDPRGVQEVRSSGGFGELALLLGPVDLSLEVFYASGDPDPDPGSPLTQFTMAEDLNAGLHLFEHILAYQTERSVAVGTQNLKGLNPPSFPLDGMASRGGVQNALVWFPQVVARPLAWMSVRGGVMLAATRVRSVDPIATNLRGDGDLLEDDFVNLAGGTGGAYWGTEYDLGMTLTPWPGMALDLEMAWVQPGDALQDEHGDAVNSFFSEARLTWFTD